MNVSRREVYTGRVFLLALMAFTVLPFLSIATTALQPSGSLPSGLAWPTHPHWGNFVEAFKVANVTTLLKSSTLIVLTVVPISLVISTMAGFAIGLIRIPGAKLLLVLFVFGLTLPFEGIITPLYFLARDLGILNTRLAISLPLIGLFMPFAVFWMRAHFAAMPAELSEAAEVDGAGTWNLFWRIHVPLARPPIASLGILMSIWTWNQFLLALVLVEDPTQRTMAGALGAFQGHYATNIPLLCAGTIIILLPTLVLFPVLPAPHRRRPAPGLRQRMNGAVLPALSLRCVHDAEVVALGIEHPGVAIEPLLDGGAEGDEPLDFDVPVRRVDVEVHRRLRPPLEFDLLKADLDVGPVDDDGRVGLWCESERGEPGDLGIVVGPHIEPVQRGGPEAGE